MRNRVKKLIQHLLTAITFVSLTIFSSCQDEPEVVRASQPSVIQFSNSLQNITEGSEATIMLTLDKSASNNGSVVVAVETNAIYNQHYITDPAVASNSFLILPIEKGQESVEINVTAIENTLFEGSKYVIFKLNNPGQGFQLGTLTSITLTICDDEGPSIANFAINSATVDENNAAGIVVQIPLSASAKGNGSITVTIDPGQAVYGTHFITEPTAMNNSITFNVPQNEEGVSFTVFPINNDLYTDDFTLSFSITSVSGVVQEGNSLHYSLVIQDDEVLSIVNFTTNNGTVDENNTAGIVVEILFSNPAAGTGTIYITVDSNSGVVYGQDFTTDPEAIGYTITLPVNKNQHGASFKILPIDNSYSDYSKHKRFTLSGFSGVINLGTNITYDLTIKDDEIPITAGFEETTGLIDEDDPSGIEVKIIFSEPLLETTNFTIQGPDGYGFVYYTNPEMTGFTESYCDPYCWGYCDYCTVYYTSYQLLFSVPKDATSFEFLIKPIDNVVSNVTIGFSLYEESPDIQIENGYYALTITP